MPGMTRFPVVRIVEFCTRYPWPVLVSAAVIAAAAGFYAVDHFAITTNVSNLLSSRLPSHEGETQYEKVFSDRTIVAVVTAPTPELVDRASDSLTARLEYIPGSARSDRDAVFTLQQNEAGSVALRWEITGVLQPGKSGVVSFQARIR